MGSGSGNHNNNCAKAKGHACRCTGCGGSLHGWEGWIALASDPDGARQSRRHEVNSQWAEHYKPPKKLSNKMSRAASIDTARLDIADWLANQEVVVQPSQEGGVPNQSESPPSVAASTANAETETSDESGDRASAGPGGAPRFADAQRSLNEADAEPEDHGPPSLQPAGPFGEPTDAQPGLSPIDQVERLAVAMTSSVWEEIATELGGDTKAVKDIKRELAHHGWCDLFVGLARAIDTCGKALDHIPEWIKRQVKEAILNSSMQQKRPHVTNAVVDIVVDRVWSAFKGAVIGSTLAGLTVEDTVRSLRILAVFTCPAPGDHKEVREHALRPLEEDVRAILTAQTKARLKKLFEEWMAGV